MAAGKKAKVVEAGSGKKAKISSETKAAVAVKLTSRVCACGCGEHIPSNAMYSTERTTFGLLNGRQKSNTRMYYYIKGHETR